MAYSQRRYTIHQVVDELDGLESDFGSGLGSDDDDDYLLVDQGDIAEKQAHGHKDGVLSIVNMNQMMMNHW